MKEIIKAAVDRGASDLRIKVTADSGMATAGVALDFIQS